MEKQKYRCKICGQVIKANPDGSCPLCGAPKEMLVIYRDKDEEDIQK